MARYNPISVAVIDLFASSLGAFMVLFFINLPFNKVDSGTPEASMTAEEIRLDMDLQDASGLTGYFHVEQYCNQYKFNWHLSFWGENTGLVKYQSQSTYEDLVLAQEFKGYYMSDNRIAELRTRVIEKVGEWGGPALSMSELFLYSDRAELHGHGCKEIDGPIVIPKQADLPKELPVE